METMKRAQVLDLIGQHAREVVPGLDDHVFVPSDRLAELGANSVDRAEIVMLVQESLRLAVPRVELFGPTNIGELADLLVSRLSPR
jgi:polyketide biosynthesis acyl carrier protein